MVYAHVYLRRTSSISRITCSLSLLPSWPLFYWAISRSPARFQPALRKIPCPIAEILVLRPLFASGTAYSLDLSPPGRILLFSTAEVTSIFHSRHAVFDCWVWQFLIPFPAVEAVTLIFDFPIFVGCLPACWTTHFPAPSAFLRLIVSSDFQSATQNLFIALRASCCAAPPEAYRVRFFVASPLQWVQTTLFPWRWEPLPTVQSPRIVFFLTSSSIWWVLPGLPLAVCCLPFYPWSSCLVRFHGQL